MIAQAQAYIPQDRRDALLHGQELPDRVQGSVLFADISGFTPLTEALAQEYGLRRGAEELLEHLNKIFEVLISQVDQWGGSVVGFAGDAVLCWFDEAWLPGQGYMPQIQGVAPTGRSSAPARATACAVHMQRAIQPLQRVMVGAHGEVRLGLKAAVASGPARRFVVGEAHLQWLDVLVGETVVRSAVGERLARRGEVLVDEATFHALEGATREPMWRFEAGAEGRFAVLKEMPEPDCPAHTLSRGERVHPEQPHPRGAEAPTPKLDAETLRPWVLEEPTPKLDAETLRPWVLPAVWGRLSTGLGEFLTELRPAVTMFVRFSGIDYDRDNIAGLKLDIFVRQAQGVVTRWGGSLMNATFGDKGSYLSVLFGAPVSHEDDAWRAVACALDLRRAASRLKDLGPLQIGISRGVALTGTYGGASRRVYSALGDDVNLAARLMMLAAPDEILVSGPVRNDILAAQRRELINCEVRPAAHLKGKAESVAVYAVLGIQRRRDLHLQEPVYALPMVGRETDMALLADKMDQALQGQGQIVSLWGEAGMGKSRLAAEAIRVAYQRGFTGFGGGCQADSAHASYTVWKGVWQALFDLDASAPPGDQAQHLELVVGELAPARLPALPLLGGLLDLPLPETDFTSSLDPQFRKLTLEATLVECFQAAAHNAAQHGGGILLVLEDLHWIDPLSQDLLERIGPAIAHLPVLVLLAARPADSARLSFPRLAALPYYTRHNLQELPAADTRRIIAAKLAQLFPALATVSNPGTPAIPPELVERVVQQAQGNPFYVEELLNWIHDLGLDPTNVSALETLEMPTNLHSLVLSRIDQLTPRQQLILKVSSVLGREFRFSHLLGFYPSLGPSGALRADLSVLAHLELTPVHRTDPELTYLFKHMVTREVAYESIPHTMRSSLHERYARFLEEFFAGADAYESRDTYLNLLAFHYEHSQNLEKKRYYLRRAGEAAAKRYANSVALDYLGRALEVTEASEEVWGLLLAREAVYNRIGKREAQHQDLLQMERLANEMQDCPRQSEVALHQARYCEVTGDYPAAIAAAQQSIRLAQQVGDQIRQVEGYRQWGIALLDQGDLAAARAQLEQALMMIRAVHHLSNGSERSVRQVEADSLRSLGVICARMGNYTEARRTYSQALTLYQELGDRRGEGLTLNNLGVSCADQGDYASARQCYDQSLRICHEIGDRRGEGLAFGNLGVVYSDQGLYEQARTCYEQALSIRRDIGDRRSEGSTILNLGAVFARQGDWEQARSWFEQGLQRFRELGDRMRQGYALASLGEVHMYFGEWDAAEACYQEALALRRELAVKVQIIETWAGLARVALARDELHQALAHVEEILAYLDADEPLDGAEEPLRIHLTCFHTLQAAGDVRASMVLRRAYAWLQQRANRMPAEERRTYLEKVPSNRQLLQAYLEMFGEG